MLDPYMYNLTILISRQTSFIRTYRFLEASVTDRRPDRSYDSSKRLKSVMYNVRITYEYFLSRILYTLLRTDRRDNSQNPVVDD